MRSVAAWLAAGLAVTVDQLTKAAAFKLVANHGEIQVAPFLTITSGMNTGVAFGFATGGDPTLLIAVATAVVTVVLVIIVRSASSLHRAALGMILGGGIGNVADRLRFGGVRDFVDLHWGGLHWPTFNLADAFITVGVVIVLIASDPSDRKSEPRSTHRGDA